MPLLKKDINFLTLSLEIAADFLSTSDIATMKFLDLTGLNCPLPILKTKQQLNAMQAQEIVMVIVTDGHAEIDFKAYLARVNHQLIHFCKHDDLYIFYIKKN